MTDPTLKELLDKAEAQFPAMIEEGIKKLYHHEFADFDCDTLRKMTPKELAAWQTRYPMDSPQYIIAAQEWNRRALVKQTRWMKFSAILAAFTTIAGIFIGTILKEYQERNRQTQRIEVICKTPSSATVQSPIEKETQKKIAPSQKQGERK